MAEIVKTVKREPSITPECEAKLLAQLEEMKPQIYAYMDEVFALANEYHLQIGKVLNEANRMAQDLEFQLFDEVNDKMSLLYINGD